MCFSVRVIAPWQRLSTRQRTRRAPTTETPKAESQRILFQICLRFWKGLLSKTTPKTTCLKCRGLLPRLYQVKHQTIYRHNFLSHFRAAFLASRSFRSPHVKQISFRRYGPQPRLRQAETPRVGDKVYHLSFKTKNKYPFTIKPFKVLCKNR